MKSFGFGGGGGTKKAGGGGGGGSKKEIEDQRKKDDESAAAEAFEEYVATFQDNANAKANKVWVKAGTYDAGKRRK
jgi:U2-associated protein SR140